MLRIDFGAFPTVKAYAIFKVQPDAKNFFQPRLNFSNPPTSCTPYMTELRS